MQFSPHSPIVLQDKFHPEEILTGSASARASNKGAWGGENKLFSRFMRQYLVSGTRYVQSYC